MEELHEAPVVLVIDDDAPMRRTYRELLETEGYRVISADNRAGVISPAAVYTSARSAPSAACESDETRDPTAEVLQCAPDLRKPLC